MKKLNIWTITIIEKRNNKNDGDMYMMEIENTIELKEKLRELKISGQDMEYVTIFPPQTGFIGTNFEI